MRKIVLTKLRNSALIVVAVLVLDACSMPQDISVVETKKTDVVREKPPIRFGPKVGDQAGNSSDQGQFVVTNVSIDPRIDNFQSRYFTDDPRYMGRLITVGARTATIGGETPCRSLYRKITNRTVSDWLQTISTRRGSNKAIAPTPSDFDLLYAQQEPIQIIEYECENGSNWSNAFNFSLDGEKRFLYWQGEVLLTIELATADNLPVPSFASGTVLTPTQRAICDDPVVAGWDRSVASAYSINLKGGDGDLQWNAASGRDAIAVRQGHRNFLAERDQCGEDTDCLLDIMFSYTDTLMRRQYGWPP